MYMYARINIFRSTSSNHVLMYVILYPTDTASEAGQVSVLLGSRLDVIICGNHPKGCLPGRLPVCFLLVYINFIPAVVHSHRKAIIA